MKYNLFAVLGFLSFLSLFFFLRNFSKREYILKPLAASLLLYKTVYYVRKNLLTSFCPPIEISAQSYFVVPLCYLFGGKKGRPCAAVLGILCGAGFFLGYGTLGFYLWNKLPHNAFFTAVVCHGTLLLLGLSCFFEEKFLPESKNVCISVILFLSLLATSFFEKEGADLFFWRVLRPSFLFPATLPWQIPAILLYYLSLVFLLSCFLSIFFKLNRSYFQNREEKENV